MSSPDCCYKIFGVRWSTLFQRSFRTPSPAVFRYFSMPSTPSPLPSLLGSSPLMDEDEVAFDPREPSYTGNSMLSALSSRWAWGEDREAKELNLESSMPAIKDYSPRTSRVTRSDTAEAAGIPNKDVTRTGARRSDSGISVCHLTLLPHVLLLLGWSRAEHAGITTLSVTVSCDLSQRMLYNSPHWKHTGRNYA